MLVEDNPNDIELTMIGFQQARIGNPAIVARDGQEALDYLFGQGDTTSVEEVRSHLELAYVQMPVTFENFQVVASQLGLFWSIMNIPPPPPKRL